MHIIQFLAQRLVLSRWRERPLLFFHVHKTAGMSFVRLFDQCYTTDEVCPADWPYRHRLYQIQPEEIQRARFIRGHFAYDPIMAHFSKKPVRLIFLREPVSRFISHFKHLKRAEGDPPGIHPRIKDLSLDEFVKIPELASSLANMSVRLLSGIEPDEAGTIDLQKAKERLATFDWIGLTEHFEASMQLFCWLFGLPPIRYFHRENVAPAGGEEKAISPETLQRIEDLNAADRDLYEFARLLFEKRYAEYRKWAWLRSPPRKVRRYFCNFHVMPPGQGWYIGERHPQYGIVRWSGPETASFMCLPPFFKGAYRLRFCVINAIDPDVLRSLKVELNDHPVPVKGSSQPDGSTIFEGSLSPSLLADRRENWLRFEISATYRPRDRIPNSQDSRLLGLCYAWLSIDPQVKEPDA